MILDEGSYGVGVLSSCFALKSSNTLKNYSEWLCGRGLADWLPLVEQHVWRYLQYLRVSVAPPNKGCSFVEAVRFGHLVLHINGSRGILCPQNCSHASDLELGSQQIPWPHLKSCACIVAIKPRQSPPSASHDLLKVKME